MTKKKLMMMVVAVAVAFGAWAETETVGGYTWTYQINGDTAEISGVSPSTGSVTIPAALGGKTVTSIGDSVFSGCSGLTSVTIPASVTSIGEWAFSDCSGLTSVTIPASVTDVGYSAFDNCTNVTDVVVPGWTCNIPFGAVTNLVISEGATNIRSYAFSGCSGLSSVTIPASVTNIGECAFNNCNGLMSISVADANPNYKAINGLLLSKDGTTLIKCINKDAAIPASVTSIGEGAFFGCSGLTSVTIPDSVTGIGSYAFYNCSGLTSVTIPASVTSIGSYAFSGCSGLARVTIGNGVTSIGSYAFSGCSGLTSVTIPDSVTSIGSSAFSGCSGLAGVTIPDSVTSIGSYAFSGCSGLARVTIGNGVTSIGVSAFSGCSGLTSVTIPDSVTSIGVSAFSGCSGLTSVTIPDSVTSIGYEAFYNCSGLTSVTIPASVTSISGSAFYGCDGLTSFVVASGNKNYSSLNGLLLSKDGKVLIRGVNGDVTIPDVVASVGDDAFNGCHGLTSVMMPNSVSCIGENAFSECNGLMSFLVSADNANFSSKDGFLLSKDGRTLIQGVNGDATIPDGIMSIGSRAFYHCEGLTSVTIPNSVTNIEECAFEGCRGLKSVTVPSSVTSMGYGVFYDCRGLVSVAILNGSIGESDLFDGCDNLTSVTIPQSVFSAGLSRVLPSYQTITNIVIADGTTTIGSDAFRGCASLRSLTVPSSVKSIAHRVIREMATPIEIHISDLSAWCNIRFGYDPFYCQYMLYLNGKEVSDLRLPEGLTKIGQDTFNRCVSLRMVEIPSGVASIEDGAFYMCDNLEWVNMASSVVFLGDSAFGVCGKLKGIAIPWDASTLRLWAVRGCQELKIAFVPLSLKETIVERRVFEGCSDDLRIVYCDAGSPDLNDYDAEVIRGMKCSAITFEANGGEVAKRQKKVLSDWPAGDLPVPVRSGWAFAGWWTAKSGGTQISEDTKVVGDATYYAHWVLKSNCYQVRFHKNDASNDATAEQLMDAGVETRLPSLSSLGWAKRGLDFLGWATSRANADAGKVWKKDWAVVSSPVAAGQTLDVYAVWARKPGSYAIQFIRNDGAGTWRTVGFNYGEKTRIPSVANGLGWARRGYDFKGWALTTADANAGKVWKGDWAYVATPVKAGEVLTVYAVWALKPGYYQIRFNKNDGTGKWRTLGFECDKSTKLSSIAALGWERPGCTFRGWASNKANADAGKVWKPDGEWVTNATAEGRTLSIYAIWE